MEGKVARVAASKSGNERVSISCRDRQTGRARQLGICGDQSQRSLGRTLRLAGYMLRREAGHRDRRSRQAVATAQSQIVKAYLRESRRCFIYRKRLTIDQ